MPPREYYLPSRRLVSQEDASVIENAKVPRSKFVGSWTRLMPFDAAYLYPFLVDEILPGDHMRYDVTAYVRMSTPLFPLYSNQRVDTFFFFVPNRILWNNFVRMMGEQDSPGDSINYLTPYIQSAVGGFPVNSLYDYFGIPTVGQINGAAQIEVNALPLRAYNRIYNDWFRDENLVTRAPVNTGDGPDALADYTLRRRAKSHDYFTSALPWPQKFTAPATPLSGTAPVLGLGVLDPTASVNSAGTFRESGGGTRPYASIFDETAAWKVVAKAVATAATGVPDIVADLSAATGVTINAFRQAFMIQTLLERDARGGTRYTELIRSHFGVVNPDFRLQRPEYIGGGQTPINITPIAQTAPTAGVPLGALGAAGTAAGGHHASYSATEHGFIIGLINVRSELAYQQGLHRMWARHGRYDYYWPAFAGLGEQAILREEIFCDGIDANDIIVFGYQERWQHYRTRYSEVVGRFRSTAASTIDQWHLAQKFATAPVLNETFINDTPDMDRVLAAGAAAVGQQYLADILINRTAVRQIPMFGTPATLGRF